MGLFGAMAGLNEQAMDILGETIEAHPDKFDADLELVKIHQGAEQYDEAEQALQAVYDRGGVRDINVLKAYTSFLSSRPISSTRGLGCWATTSGCGCNKSVDRRGCRDG